MNTRFLLTAVALIVVLMVGAYFVFSNVAKNAQVKESERYKNAQQNKNRPPVTEGAFAPQFPKEMIVEEEKEQEVQKEVPTKPTVVTTPKPAPAPIPTPVSSPYTTATVATHNGATSCWTIVSGKVYDVTSFIGKHPGGEKNILKICGKDGTSLFMGQHGGDSKPESTLAKYYLGALSQ